MEVAERVKILMVAGKTTAFDDPNEKLDEKMSDKNKNSEGCFAQGDKGSAYGIDECLVEEGNVFFQANFFSVCVSMLTGLWSLMFINTIVRVLSLTKRSHTATLAFKRYLSTLQHVVRWHEGVEEMKESLKVVRGQHKAAAIKAETEENHGISQFDMVVTQWAFIGPTLLFPTQLGISNDYCERELEGLVYIMYLVGKELGVMDKYNLCQGGLNKAKAYSQEILIQVIQPGVKQNLQKEESALMAAALLAGVNIINPLIEPEALVKFVLKLFMMEEFIENKRNVTNYSCFMSYTMDIVFNKLLHLPTIGGILRTTGNNLMRLDIFLASNWEGFLFSYYQYKGMNVSAVDRVLAILAIPVMTGITGVTMLWRYVDKLNLMLIMVFYMIVFLMVK